VRERLAQKMELGQICEEIFTRCIADDPRQTGGLGGDNMTAIVIMLGPELRQ